MGDDEISNSFRKTLEQNLNKLLPTLISFNAIQKEKNYYNRLLIEENRARVEQNEKYTTAGKTSGGALAGAGIGAMIGGPPGAAIGFFLGGIFGYNM